MEKRKNMGTAARLAFRDEASEILAKGITEEHFVESLLLAMVVILGRKDDDDMVSEEAIGAARAIKIAARWAKMINALETEKDVCVTDIPLQLRMDVVEDILNA